MLIGILETYEQQEASVIWSKSLGKENSFNVVQKGHIMND